MSSNSTGIPAGRLAQYAMLVASVPGLERRGSKAPYTSLNGNKSSFLTDTGSLALRLDSEGREAFMRQHDAHLCERHGRVMKEYVAVPERLWKQRKVLRRAFVSSVAYVGSLKPKVSKRKKLTASMPVREVETSGAEAAPVTSRTTVARKSARKAAVKKPAAKPRASKSARKKTVATKSTSAAASSAKKAARKRAAGKEPPPKKAAATKAVAKKTATRKSAPKKAAPKAAARKGAAVERSARRRKAVAGA